jgi:hypothetical protein
VVRGALALGLALAAAQAAAAAPASQAVAAPASPPIPPPAPAAPLVVPPPAPAAATFEPEVLVEVHAAPRVDDASDVARDAPGVEDDRLARARLRWALLGAHGRVGGVFSYRLQLAAREGAELDDGRLRPAGTHLRLAEAAYAPGPWFVAAAGEMVVPFGRLRLTELADLDFLERPRFVEQLTPGHRVGGALRGDLGMLSYELSMQRARPTVPTTAPAAPGTDYDGALVVGRLEVRPVGPIGRAPAGTDVGPWEDRVRVAVGVAGLYNSGSVNSRAGLAADAVVRWRALTLAADVIYLSASADAVAGTRRSLGVNAEAGLVVRRHLQLHARYEWSDGALGADPLQTELPQEWAARVGAALLLARDRVRLLAEYVHRGSTLPTGAAGTADAVLLGARASY